MAFKIKMLHRANSEMDEAVARYSSKQENLGERFFLAVEAELQRIENNPYLFPITKGKFRKATVSKFPYIIIYRISKKEIIVQSVFNTYQNSNKKP